MISATRNLHDEKLDALTSAYTAEGFQVIKEPLSNQLPFDLSGYRPDLLAFKENSGLLIDVKTKASRVSIDRLQSLAEEISSHPGWRFLLVTLEDIDANKLPNSDLDLPSWQQLQAKFAQAQILVAEGAIEPALLYLWSIFESGLRKQAIAQVIPVERLPANILLNHMYSLGEISVADIDLFREFMAKRDRIAHGANESIEPAMLAKILLAVKNLLMEWSEGSMV